MTPSPGGHRRCSPRASSEGLRLKGVSKVQKRAYPGQSTRLLTASYYIDFKQKP